jgi:hypothetical protein
MPSHIFHSVLSRIIPFMGNSCWMAFNAYLFIQMDQDTYVSDTFCIFVPSRLFIYLAVKLLSAIQLSSANILKYTGPRTSVLLSRVLSGLPPLYLVTQIRPGKVL